MQGTGTAAGEEREVTRVKAAAYGLLLDLLNHIVVHDIDDAECRLVEILPQRLTDMLHDRLFREVLANLHATTEQLRAQSPEDDVRIGDRRLRAAAVVARRTRHSPRTLRANAEEATLIDIGDGAATCANRAHIDHRHHRGVTADLRVEQMLHTGLEVGQHGDIGRCTANIEGDDILNIRELRRPDGAEHAAYRTGEQQVDRLLLRRLRRSHAAEGLHEMHVGRIALRVQIFHQLLDIARRRRANIGIEPGRREALILAELRQYLGTQREINLGILLLDDFFDALFMRGIQKGKEETDRDGLDAILLHLAHRCPDLILVERDELGAIRRNHAFRDTIAVAALTDRVFLPGDILHDGEIRRPLMTRDMDDIAVPLRRDHTCPCAFMLEHHVRRDGRAMENLVDLPMVEMQLIADGVDALHHADRRIGWRRRSLVDLDLACIIHIDKIGKRTADVDTHSFHRCSLLYKKAKRRRCPGDA